MKHKVSKQFTSILLALVMIISMIPVSALTAFAAGKTEVAQIETRLSAEHVPYAGMEYKDLYTWIDGAIYGSAQNSGSDWADDAGVTIDIKGDGDFGEWYDIRYQFEAGRTYTAEYTYMINPAYEETHMFTESTTVTLTNPDPSKCTITGEVIEVRDSGRIVDVRYTMTIAGERNYPDIQSATLQKITTPADGAQAETTEVMYSNCTLTSQAWSPNVSTFAAGYTYTLTVNLHANDGYKFADDFAPVLGIAGYEKAADYVELLNGNKDAAVSFTYAVGDYTIIDTLELEPISNAANFLPVAGESARYFPDVFEPGDGDPYEKEWLSSRQWYNEDDKTNMEQGDVFEAGKTYSYHSIFKIKTENEGTHRFASPTVQIENFIYQNDVQTEVGDDPLRIYVTFYYTCKFPEGIGDSAGNPAVCHTYDEFKYAMENEDIRYVALGDVEDMLPAIPHDEEKEPDGITRTAIVVRGHKDLNLLGNAVFRCPLTGNYDLKYYIQLLTLTDAANSSLYIHGNGSLTYAGGTLNFVNSVIKMEGGHLTVDGATIRGSNGYHTGFCYGINAIFGSVGIQGGATVIGEIYGGDDGICAMAIGEEGETRSLSVSIFDGKFYVERDTGDGDLDHGIAIWNDCGLRIYGMSTDGIRLGRYAADTLDNYVMEGCVMTVGGVNTDPATRGTTDGHVEVYQEISEVEIYVETPVAGESATVYPEEVYWVPEGCTVDSIVWYKNGEALNLAYAPRFEAGSSYRVEVTLVADNGVRFANPLTNAEISYKTATVNAHGGNAQKGIVMSVDFGECPNIVPEVDLTVTAPKEGNTPSYTVGCGSDAYYAVGGSSNYTDYRQWYESSDGEVWWKINPDSKFTADYYYKLVVDIRTNNGYEFPLIDNGTIWPNVSATVNGYYANVIKAYEQDPSRYITVEYNFGECSDSIVEKITVENVTAPVAGEKPNYNYSIRGGGYQMNTAKNAYYDAYWKNPPEQWYFIKNGIGWYDLTKNDWVYEHETFIAGHEYQVRVYLKTEDGFEFAHTKNYEPTVSATVNGYAAEAITTGSDCAWNQQVQYTFTCTKKDVSTIMIYGLDEPQGDNIPDREITTAYPELYTVEYINWYDCEDNLLYGEDTFRSGERYKVEIKIVPTQIGGVNVSQFVSPVKAYIDGQEVTERLNWDAVFAKSDAVYVYYTFMKGASAPIENPYVFITRPVDATVNAGQTHTVYWQTSFIPTLTEIQYWDGEAWDQWYVQQPEQASDSYAFVNADAASYRFRIVAYVGNDAVATSDDFVITWEETPVNKYTVSFNAGGGTGTMEDVTGISGEYTLPANGFTAPNGMQFKAWNVDGDEKQVGDKITVSSNTTVIAVWEAVEYNVTVTDGWAYENGWVYYLNGVKVINQWMADTNGWCFLGADGFMVTNSWIMDSQGWCYVGSDGYCITNQWMADSIGWCYLNAEGRMATNQWIADSQGWCYVGADGYCVTNQWMADSIGWCYLDASGRMATNRWIMDSQGWCYVGADGYCLTNCWMADSIGWCYLDGSGRMVVNGWVQDSTGWCWLDESGYWDGIYH